MSPNGFGGNPADFARRAKRDEFFSFLISQFFLSNEEFGEDGSSPGLHM